MILLLGIVLSLAIVALIYACCKLSRGSDEAALRQYRELVERKEKREDDENE